MQLKYFSLLFVDISFLPSNDNPWPLKSHTFNDDDTDARTDICAYMQLLASVKCREISAIVFVFEFSQLHHIERYLGSLVTCYICTYML